MKNAPKNTSATTKSATASSFLPIVAQNLQTLIDEQGITQKYLHKLTGVAESTISKYKNGTAFPSIDFLLCLRKEYGISIDDFITKNIAPAEIAIKTPSSEIEKEEQIAYRKFCGTYLTYYFDTSNYKGRDYNTPEESLLFGVLRIYETPSPTNALNFSCLAIFGIKIRTVAESLKQKLENIHDINAMKVVANDAHIASIGHIYSGSFELVHDHAFLSLSQGTKDKALIILHRPKGNMTKYKSGIGTINSLSTGRDCVPVVQFIGLSRNKVELSYEEIHRSLLLHYPNFKAKKETDELIRLVKNLYVDKDENYESFTDLQKRLTIRSELERYIHRSLESNMFRYGKISTRDDDDWYHAIKEISSLNAIDHTSKY